MKKGIAGLVLVSLVLAILAFVSVSISNSMEAGFEMDDFDE